MPAYATAPKPGDPPRAGGQAETGSAASAGEGALADAPQSEPPPPAPDDGTDARSCMRPSRIPLTALKLDSRLARDTYRGWCALFPPHLVSVSELT